MQILKKSGNLNKAGFKIKRRLDPGIAHISHGTNIVRTDAIGLVEPADEARLVSDLTWPVAGTRPVRHPSVERHTDQANLNTVDVFP
ncbi:uncharacterized protein METZ01_LOCUS240663, partial [marine metagenome]